MEIVISKKNYQSFVNLLKNRLWHFRNSFKSQSLEMLIDKAKWAMACS